MNARMRFRLNQDVRLTPLGMERLKYRHPRGVVRGFCTEDHLVRVKWEGRVGTYAAEFWEPCGADEPKALVELPAGMTVFVIGLPVTLTAPVVVEADAMHVATINGAKAGFVAKAREARTSEG